MPPFQINNKFKLNAARSKNNKFKLNAALSGENRPAWQARQQPCAVINKLGLNGALSKE